MNVRQSPRIPIHCPCSFSGGAVRGEGIVVNLSRPGCAVETSTPPPTGTRLELHLLLPVHFFPVAVDQAEVVWAHEGRFGVKFIRVRPDDESRLHRVVEQVLRRDPGPAFAPVVLVRFWNSWAPPCSARPSLPPSLARWRGAIPDTGPASVFVLPS